MFNKPEAEDGRTEPMNHSIEQSMLPKTPIRTQATIGPSIKISGDVLDTGNEGVRIEGCVDGTISLSNNILTVGKEGQIKATIDARAIFVEGKVEGDLKGEEQIVIHSSGDVHGNIVAPRVTLEDGCKFKGSIDMELSADRVSGGSSRREKIANIKSAVGGSGDAPSGGGLGKVPGQ